MALGKPVVTFLHDEAVRRTEEAFGIRVPIVSATAETLRETLRPLVADAARRRELGAASRAYVERVHDLERGRRPPARPLRSSLDDLARSADAAARQALGGLRARRDRLARDRGVPAADLHALPRPVRPRRRRPRRRALGRARHDPPRRHLVAPSSASTSTRPTPRTGCSSLRTSFWFTMASATLGLVAGVLLAEPIADLLGLDDPNARPRRLRRHLGADELRAADVAVPGRGALGRVRVREPREHRGHDRRDDAPRRRLGAGRARRHRRQLHRHAHRLPRPARRTAARSSGSSSRGRCCAR